MLPSMLATETIAVLAPGVRLDYGRQVADWSQPTVEATVDGCVVQPEQTTEIIDGREAAVWVLRVWAPPGTPVGAASRVRWRGTDYRVVGEPQLWADPTSHDLDHLTFTITTTRG